MIDRNDKQTQDAFPAKRRGRPPTGNAMTAAEKKRAQRERDQFAYWGDTKPDMSAITQTGLLEILAKAVSLGQPHLAKQVADELVRRAKINGDSHKE